MFLKTFKSKIVAASLSMSIISVLLFGYGLAQIYYQHMQKCVSRSLGFLATIIEHEYNIRHFNNHLGDKIIKNPQIDKILHGGLIDDFKIESVDSFSENRIYQKINPSKNVYISSSNSKINSELKNMIIKKWLYFLTTFIISIAIIVILIRYLFLPLNSLVNHCLTCSDPDSKPTPVSGFLELQALRDSIITLQQRISSLQKIQHESMKALAHELKTPLAQLRLRIDIADENSEWNQEQIGLAREEIDEISHKITQILEKSAVMGGLVNINIKNRISLWVEKLESLYKYKNLYINIDIDENKTITVKKEPFERVFTTLIENCINHSENNSQIYITYDDNKFILKNSIGDANSGIISSTKHGLQIAQTISKHLNWNLYHTKTDKEYISYLELKTAPLS